MSNFQYQERSNEAWKSREEQKGGGYISFLKDSVKIFAPQKSDNYIRFLPPTWANAKHYGLDIWVHYSVGPQQAQVLCLLKMKNQRCPICDAYLKADAEGRDDAQSLKPTRRVLVWLLNRKDEKQPFAWAQPWTFDRDVAAQCRDRQTGELYQIDHPDVGFDVSFERDEQGDYTKYIGVQIARRPSPVESRHLDYILANPLSDILLFKSYEEVRDLYEGQSAVEPDAATQNPTQQQPGYDPRAQFTQPTPLPAESQPRTVLQPQPQLVPQPQPVIHPVPVSVPSPAFCNKEIITQGRVLGCIYALGHPGYCDFSRDTGQAPPTQSSPQPQPQPQPYQPSSTSSHAEPSIPIDREPSRAEALKERFGR